jgi:hypothetical protein
MKSSFLNFVNTVGTWYTLKLILSVSYILCTTYASSVFFLHKNLSVQTFLNQGVYFEVQGDYDRTWNFWKYFLEILQSHSFPSFLYPRNFSFPLSFDVMVSFRASIAVTLSHAMVTCT